MLLLSGRANTRCSVCRFDPGGPAPGTGLESPETGSQNRGYRDLDRRQRPHTLYVNPRNPPQSAHYSSETRKRRFVSECVVVDAVPYELVSAAKFPDIREFTGNFLQFTGKWP